MQHNATDFEWREGLSLEVKGAKWGRTSESVEIDDPIFPICSCDGPPDWVSTLISHPRAPVTYVSVALGICQEATWCKA